MYNAHFFIVTSNTLYNNQNNAPNHNTLICTSALLWIIWLKHKAHKEATFLWSVIHKAMAVKEWRG